MKKSKLYTRKGDRGMTTIASGIRVSKASSCIEACGTVDELNSALGYLVSLLGDDCGHRNMLLHVQEVLFYIGNVIVEPKTKVDFLHDKELSLLESQIDIYDEELPELRSFIIPGGSSRASFAHVCRTICRRAERRILTLSLEQHVPTEITAYMNRLSDYLFVLSRKLNIIDNVTEKSMDKTCS